MSDMDILTDKDLLKTNIEAAIFGAVVDDSGLKDLFS
jgi:hypothetical protein